MKLHSPFNSHVHGSFQDSFQDSFQVRGFTLIELVISLAILALIATMAMPMGEVIVQRNKEQELKHALREISPVLMPTSKLTMTGISLKK